MKLFLTSDGLKNKTLADALVKMSNKDASELSIAFIPTAVNPFSGNKSWLKEHYKEYESLKPKQFDIVDIETVSKDLLILRLKSADVIVFGGGSSFYLLDQMKKSGVMQELPSLLANSIYVGISAGSIIASRNTKVSSDRSRQLAKELGIYDKAEKGLGLIDFHLRPHMNSPVHKHLNWEYAEKLAEKVDGALYAYDDDTAIQVIDGEVKIVSEGEWKKYN